MICAITCGERNSRSAQAGCMSDAPEQARTSAGPTGKAACFTIPIAACSMSASATRTDRGRSRDLGRPHRRQLRQWPWPTARTLTINGPFKVEVIHKRGPWRSLASVEDATLEWVDRSDHPRPHEPVGNGPPAAAEAACHAGLEAIPMAA